MKTKIKQDALVWQERDAAQARCETLRQKLSIARSAEENANDERDTAQRGLANARDAITGYARALEAQQAECDAAQKECERLRAVEAELRRRIDEDYDVDAIDRLVQERNDLRAECERLRAEVAALKETSTASEGGSGDWWHADRVCEECGGEFEPEYQDQVFCSQVCETSGRKKMIALLTDERDTVQAERDKLWNERREITKAVTARKVENAKLVEKVAALKAKIEMPPPPPPPVDINEDGVLMEYGGRVSLTDVLNTGCFPLRPGIIIQDTKGYAIGYVALLDDADLEAAEAYLREKVAEAKGGRR